MVHGRLRVFQMFLACRRCLCLSLKSCPLAMVRLRGKTHHPRYASRVGRQTSSVRAIDGVSTQQRPVAVAVFRRGVERGLLMAVKDRLVIPQECRRTLAEVR